jgi:hypothetical protein
MLLREPAHSHAHNAAKFKQGIGGRGFIDRLQKRPLTPASTEKTKRAYVLIGNIRDFCGVDHGEKRAIFPKSA